MRNVLRAEFSVDLDLITTDTDMGRVAPCVLRAADHGSWLVGLMRAVEQSARVAPRDRATVAGLGNRPALQSLITANDSFLDAGRASAAIESAMERVCRIEVAGDPSGTGFLIGADLVLTNFHVVEGAADIVARFDHRHDDAGNLLGGVSCRVTEVLEHSAYHASDCMTGEHDTAPLLTHLDYALLRLSRPVGTMLARSGKVPRGWYYCGGVSFALKPRQRLLIFQHPNGDPLKYDDSRVLSVNDNASRVRYNVNTLPGSSGALGLDASMTPAVLHHAGDPSWRPAEYNQGIPIVLVVADIEHRRPGILVPPPAKPLYLWRVRGDHPVIGRSQLQDRIRLMLADTGPPVLFVEGSERSGRSFARHLVQAQVTGEGRSCVTISLAAFAGSTPDRLAFEIAAELDLDRDEFPGPPTDRQVARWAPNLGSAVFRSLRGKARRENGTVWLIFDCTDSVALLEETQELFVDLVKRALEAAEIRVVVIGGANLVPPVVSRTTRREIMEFVLPAEVAEHLSQCASLGGRTLSKGDAEDLARVAMTELSADPLERWIELVERVQKLDAVLMGEAA